MKCHQRVDHSPHSDEGEEPRRDTADGISKVEKTDSQSAEDDGEVEPGEEGALVGEEDFGFDACGEGDALSCTEEAIRWGFGC